MHPALSDDNWTTTSPNNRLYILHSGTGCAAEAFSITCSVYVENSEGWWLFIQLSYNGRILVVQARDPELNF